MMPNKLVFRSGWNPGDLFMLVEAFARHDPLNPTAIVGLERWSSSLAEMVAEKEVSRENAVRIEDLSGNAEFVGGNGARRPPQLPTGYDRMETHVDAFSDDPLATHAQLRVANYMGFRAEQTREMLFVKNRFVLVRDDTSFDDSFRARVGPVWNTQHVGRSRGANWTDTWLTAHWYSGTLRLQDNPPWNLLLFYAPRERAALMVQEPQGRPPGDGQDDVLRHFRTVQYAWEGDVRPGTRLQFVNLLLPHAPDADAADLSRSIRVIRDEPGLAAVALVGADRWELALLNPSGSRIVIESPRGQIETDAHALYLDMSGRQRIRYSARGAAVLTVGRSALQPAGARRDSSSAVEDR
jgi:hypothetical protein